MTDREILIQIYNMLHPATNINEEEMCKAIFKLVQKQLTKGLDI